MIKYFKISKVKDWDKDKNNKLMSFHIDDEKLLETYRAICIYTYSSLHIYIWYLSLKDSLM